MDNNSEKSSNEPPVRSLRKGRILQYVMPDSHKSPGAVYPAIVIKAYTPSAGAFLVFTEDGTAYAPTVEVTDEPTRGSVFWPDTSPDAVDVEFVVLADDGGADTAAESVAESPTTAD